MKLIRNPSFAVVLELCILVSSKYRRKILTDDTSFVI